MKQEKFLKLSLMDRIQALYEKGTCVCSIRYYRHKINLYLIGDFYVEVFYNHKLDLIEKAELLENRSKRIKFYTDQIKLPENLFS